MAIKYRSRYRTKNEEIVAGLREIAGASPPIDPKMKVKRLTAELSATMALLHGGDWRVQIDHEIGFVVVRQRCPRGPL